MIDYKMPPSPPKKRVARIKKLPARLNDTVEAPASNRAARIMNTVLPPGTAPPGQSSSNLKKSKPVRRPANAQSTFAAMLRSKNEAGKIPSDERVSTWAECLSPPSSDEPVKRRRGRPPVTGIDRQTPKRSAAPKRTEAGQPSGVLPERPTRNVEYLKAAYDKAKEDHEAEKAATRRKFKRTKVRSD